MKMYVKLTSLRKVRKIALSSGSYSSLEATAFAISMMRRRTLASFTAMKALTSSRPSEVAKKSVIALELRSTFIGPPGSGPKGAPLVEELDRDLKKAGDLVQTARAHPVHALLVFLNLLEGDAASLPELLLAHAQGEHALHANSRANVAVNLLRLFRR